MEKILQENLALDYWHFDFLDLLNTYYTIFLRDNDIKIVEASFKEGISLDYSFFVIDDFFSRKEFDIADDVKAIIM